MNAANLINDEMSLEDKLKAIDSLLNDPKAKEEFNKRTGREPDAPIDPSDAFACEGCQ